MFRAKQSESVLVIKDWTNKTLVFGSAAEVADWHAHLTGFFQTKSHVNLAPETKVVVDVMPHTDQTLFYTFAFPISISTFFFVPFNARWISKCPYHSMFLTGENRIEGVLFFVSYML